MTDAALKKKITVALKKNKKGGSIFTFVFKPDNYHSGTAIVLQKMSNQGEGIIYVTLNSKYVNLIRELKKEGLDISCFYFIDCISKTTGDDIAAKNCTFIQSPRNLVEISLAVTSAINTGAFRVLIMESVNTLLMYNDSKTTEKFLHFLVNKLKDGNISGIILFLEDKEVTQILNFISQFCDECISL